MSAPVNSVQGPQVTITEFVVNTNMNPAPGGICAGSDGRVWFLHQDTGPSALGAVTTDGASFAVYKVNVTNIGPIAINPGPDGNIWYTKQQGIGKMLPSGTFTEYGAPQGAETAGIIKGPDGNMWYTEPDVDRIGSISMSGQAKDYPLPGKARAPNDIALGKDGNLWVTEKTGNNIARVTPAGVVTEYPIPTAVSNPQAITTGPDGNMWFTEHDAHNIARITPTGTVHRVRYSFGRETVQDRRGAGRQSVVHRARELQRYRSLHAHRRHLRVPNPDGQHGRGGDHGGAR